MSYLQIYTWEHETFPWFQRIKIRPEYRHIIARKIAHHFKIICRYVELNTRGGGLAHGTTIQLPNVNKSCSLGLIIHELAHLYDYQVNENSGHQKTFKKVLIKLYCELNRELVKQICDHARETVIQEKLHLQKEAEKQMCLAQKKREQITFRRSRYYKIQMLQKRVKRLERRFKGIQTRLKTATRALNLQMRLDAYEKAKQELDRNFTPITVIETERTI